MSAATPPRSLAEPAKPFHDRHHLQRFDAMGTLIEGADTPCQEEDGSSLQPRDRKSMENPRCFEDALACMEKECPAPCRMILDNVSDGILTVDHEGRIAWFNRAAERITGFQKEEVLGKPCRGVFQTDLCGTDACPLERALRRGQTISNLEVLIRNKWGRQVPVSVSMATIRDKTGQVLGSVETFRDLSLIPAENRSEPASIDLKQIMRDDILRALKENRWNRQAAAQALGMSRTTLWRKIQRLQILA